MKTNEDKGIHGLEFGVEDGTTLTGLFFSTSKKENPTMLFFHGNGEIANDYHNFSAMYTSLGINLAVIDFRGYGSSEGSPYYTSLFSDPPVVYSKLRKWLKNRGYNQDVVVMGRSLGGACAISIGAQNPEGLKGIVLESTLSSLVDMAMNKLHQSVTELPDELVSSLKNWSNYRYLPNIKVPVLLIHASNDQIIPISHAKRNYKKLQQTTEVELVVVKGAHHNNLLSYQDKYQEVIGQFLDNTL